MAFLSALSVTEVDGGARGTWRLTEQLRYQGKYDEIVAPIGFETDFASVPRMFWSTFPPYGKHTKAAVIHDYLYAYAPPVMQAGKGHVRISRKDADGIFERIMKELGVSWWRRKVMYSAVRSFGWVQWNRYRKAEQ